MHGNSTRRLDKRMKNMKTLVQISIEWGALHTVTASLVVQCVVESITQRAWLAATWLILLWAAF